MRSLVLFCALLAGACANDDGLLQASGVVVTRTMPGANVAAAYLTLRNTGQDEMRITRVSSPQFEQAHLHESTLEDGVSRMRAVNNIIVPAGGKLTLAPGGKHVMLMRARDSAAGDNLVTLHFYDNDRLLLSVSTRVES